MKDTCQTWKIISTYTNYEKKVHQELVKYNIESYLPIYLIRKQWSDRVKIKELPLFPNYLFVMVPDNLKSEVLKIKGVNRFVSFEGSPAFVRAEEIIQIRALTEQQHLLVKDHTKEVEGTAIIVMNGLLKGLRGSIIGRLNANFIKVFFESLNNIVTLDIRNNTVSVLSVPTKTF